MAGQGHPLGKKKHELRVSVKESTTESKKSVPLCIQCSWKCAGRQDIEFNAALLEKHGCSFQTKYLFAMLYKIYIRFIDCPVAQWRFNMLLFFHVSIWMMLSPVFTECSPSRSRCVVDQVPIVLLDTEHRWLVWFSSFDFIISCNTVCFPRICLKQNQYVLTE